MITAQGGITKWQRVRISSDGGMVAGKLAIATVSYTHLEKYAKILAKTIVNPDGDDSNRGQNAFFYDAAEGLLTSVILMLAEFLPPDQEHPQERRHIVSVFKLVPALLCLLYTSVLQDLAR